MNAYKNYNIQSVSTDVLIIIIIMYKEKGQSTRQAIKCGQCDKKQILIDKYLNLIQLLKKKSDRSNLSSTLKKSIDAGTTSNTSLLNAFKYQKVILPMALTEILCRQKLKVFQSIKDIYVVNNCKKAFKLLSTMQKIIEKRIFSFGKIFFTERKIQIHNQNYIFNTQRNTKLSNQKSLNNTNSICSVTCFLQSQKKQKMKSLTRKVFQLQKQLQKVRFEKKIVVDQVEQNYRRQQVESKKKKQSLQMLAEQMNEKNEIINELQSTLRFYQQKFGKFENNILQQDGLSMKKEIQRLQKLLQKLNIQIQKKNQLLQKHMSQSKINKQKIQKIELEYNELKQKNFQMCIQIQNIDRKKKQCNDLSTFLQKKLLNLKKYQKIISNNMKMIDQCSMSDKSSFNSSIKARNGRAQFDIELASENNINQMNNPMMSFKQALPISSFQNQYKIQKILNYLYNIDSQDCDLNNAQKLFDNEEYNVLIEVKKKFKQLQKIAQHQHLDYIKQIPQYQVINQIKVPNRQMKECGDNDQIYFNQNHVSGSIFDVFATEKTNKDKQNGVLVNGFDQNGSKKGHQSNSSNTNRKFDQGFTIKLLQLQIDKNKQIQKISELKNKLFHIRSIVMNLIKSLEMKLLKPQSKDIVDLCFEFFQFSEEEKEIIFHTQKKQKKFLGWF